MCEVTHPFLALYVSVASTACASRLRKRIGEVAMAAGRVTGGMLTTRSGADAGDARDDGAG